VSVLTLACAATARQATRSRLLHNMAATPADKKTHILDLTVITPFHSHQITILKVDISVVRNGAEVKYLQVERSEKAEINFNHF